MKHSSSQLLALLVLTCCPVSVVYADAFDDSYAKLRDKTVDKREKIFKSFEEELKKPHPQWVGGIVVARSPGLSQVNAVNAVATAQAAIQTSLEGAEAGFSVAPLALAGIQTNHQLSVNLGALKEGKTQVGLGWTYQDAPNITYRDLEGLGLKTCPFSPSTLKVDIDNLKSSFRRVCDDVISILRTAPQSAFQGQGDSEFAKEKEVFEYAPKVCADPALAPDFSSAAAVLWRTVENMNRRTRETGVDPDGFQGAFNNVRNEVTALKGFRVPRPDECLSEELIQDVYVRYVWEHARHQFGVGATLQAFPSIWGFNPAASTPLPSGELSNLSGRVEYNFSRAGGELVLGLGAGAERAKPADKMRPVITPSFSLAYTVAALSGTPLYQGDGTERMLSVNKGALPPRLIMGVDVSLTYALVPPVSQVARVQAFTATGFGEFRFTDDLAVRVGIPVTAELKVREANAEQGITERRDLQWSLPVFVYSALKI